MKLIVLNKHIFRINFPTQRKLASTFLRFQEHSESSKFRGKIFTLEKYKKWYISNSHEGKKTGKFTYYKGWTGFNIPSYILEPFYQGKFDPLSDEEKQLLSLFRDKRHKRFYIIGTFGNTKLDVLRHEIAHSLFYTNPRYKKEVLKILNEINKKTRSKINKYLSRELYHHTVWLDETHTWIITELDELKKNGIAIGPLLEISKKLNELFDKYLKLK